jgi:prophage regulatory protein
MDTIIRRKEVSARTGLPRSTLYLKISKGEFPSPVALGARSVGWAQSAVDSWVQQRIEAGKRGAA